MAASGGLSHGRTRLKRGLAAMSVSPYRRPLGEADQLQMPRKLLSAGKV